MSRPILLDTCALIWLADGEGLAATAEAELDRADAVFTSPISAWEVGQLAARGRLALQMEPREWFQRALELDLILAPMPPDILIASSFLPGNLLRDPADKILAATARIMGLRLMTRDGPLIEFARAGFLDVVAC